MSRIKFIFHLDYHLAFGAYLNMRSSTRNIENNDMIQTGNVHSLARL